jgi:uroporphyrinogen-III decarboxylase
MERCYPRPAWLSLPQNDTAEGIRGCAIARRGSDLFWLYPSGHEAWIPPNREAQHEAEVTERSLKWADLWDRADGSAIRNAAARPMHRLQPLPEPSPEQAQAVAASQRYELARALARRYRDGMPLYTHGTSPYNILEGIFGFQSMMCALTEQPDLVHCILENHMPRPSARLLAERQLGISIMFIEECMASADIISPGMYLEFAHRYDKQAIRLYEDMGFRTVLYFSGNLMPLLPYLNDLPFTAIIFEEDRKNYGIDLAHVRRALPDKVLFGNVDAAWLEKATDREVLDEAKRQIDIAGPDRFILSVGSPFTPGTSLDRVKLFCESTRMI